MGWNEHRGQPRSADQVALVVDEFDVPNVQPAALVLEGGAAVNVAGTDASEVIRVDFDAHGVHAALGCNEVGTDRTEGFGEDNTRPTVQEAIRLVGA